MSAEYNTITLKDLSQGGLINIARNVGKDVYDIFYDELVKLDDTKPLKIYIETNGGSALSLQKILRNLKRRKQTTMAYVQKSAHSAGAVLALACDELYMSEDATLSAIDPQQKDSINPNTTGFNSLKLVYQIYHSGDKSTITALIADHYNKLTNEFREIIIGALNCNFSVETKDNIMREMFDKPLDHSKLFFKEDISGFGVNVKVLCKDDVPSTKSSSKWIIGAVSVVILSAMLFFSL